MTRDSEQVSTFLSQLTPPLDEVASQIRALVREVAPEAVESVKWRNLHYDLKGGLCMLAVARSYLRLEFFKGADLPDPEGILEGTGKAGGRHIKLASPDAAGRREVRDILQAAVTLNLDG